MSLLVRWLFLDGWLVDSTGLSTKWCGKMKAFEIPIKHLAYNVRKLGLIVTIGKCLGEHFALKKEYQNLDLYNPN